VLATRIDASIVIYNRFCLPVREPIKRECRRQSFPIHPLTAPSVESKFAISLGCDHDYFRLIVAKSSKISTSKTTRGVGFHEFNFRRLFRLAPGTLALLSVTDQNPSTEKRNKSPSAIVSVLLEWAIELLRIFVIAKTHEHGVS
jgi:hypothetical protein